MAKYIIDIDDEYTKDWVNETPMCKELCMPISVPNRQRTYHVLTGFKLEPYTEPDREAIENEVWELAERIADMSYDDFISCFEGETEEYVYGLPYHEVKSKYEAWKQEKEEIRVGDEVIHHGDNCVVVYVGADEVYHVSDKHWSRCVVQGRQFLTKTGRHFPEVEKLLERMRGE